LLALAGTQGGCILILKRDFLRDKQIWQFGILV
jgi:hypothetical protein